MMKIKTIILTSILSMTSLFSINLSAQQVIAHRGYWNTSGSAQNSIAALMKADSIGVYGSEVDIWLSSDGVPVVNHDATVTIDGNKVSVQESPLNVLRNAKLGNGEVMPTFEEYLNAFEKCKTVKLIVEFKTHKTAEQENLLVEKVLEMVKNRGLQNKVEYISFGLNVVNKIRELDKKALTYYLNGDLAPEGINTIGASGIDYHYNVFYKQPLWVKSAHNLGQKVNVWTVNKPEDIQKMIDLKVDYITTDEPLLVSDMIKK